MNTNRNSKLFAFTTLLILLISTTNCIKVNLQAKNQTNSENVIKELHKLTITGTAQLYMDAGLVYITVTTVTERPTAYLALQDNTNTSLSVFQAINDTGIPKNNITTLSYSVGEDNTEVYNDTSKVYDSVFKGFKVTNQIQITTSNIQLAGTAIDAALKNGATSIDSVSFDISQEAKDQAKKSLLGKAAQDARSQADLVLNALDMKVVDIESVSVGSFTTSTTPSYRGPIINFESNSNASSESSSAPLYGSNSSDSQVSVTVTFIIDKK